MAVEHLALLLSDRYAEVVEWLYAWQERHDCDLALDERMRTCERRRRPQPDFGTLGLKFAPIN